MLVGLLVDVYAHGFLIAQVFFGLWLLPMGYLAYISGMFPRVLGVVLMVACAGYLIDVIALFLVPTVGEAVSGIVVLPAVVGAVRMVLYLLIRGVRPPDRPADPLSAEVSPPTLEATLRPWESPPCPLLEGPRWPHRGRRTVRGTVPPGPGPGPGHAPGWRSRTRGGRRSMPPG